MKRQTKMMLTKAFGRSVGNFSFILDVLKKGNVRVHPFEHRLEQLISEADNVLVDFVESYEEDNPKRVRTNINLFFQYEDVHRRCLIRAEIPAGVELLDGWDAQGKHWLCWSDPGGHRWNAKKDEEGKTAWQTAQE